jgi:hypothetical protein
MACGVGKRFLADPVERDACAGRDPREVPARAQLDGEPPGPCVVDERRDLACRRERWRHRRLVVASQQRDRTAKLSHAAPADVLGRPQRLLGGRRVAAQHVAGTGHLQHDGSQPVSHEVVDVARDPTPLSQQRLLGELSAGSVKLGCQFPLAGGRPTEDPREGNAQDPDTDRDLRRILDHARRHGRERDEQAQRDGDFARRGPAPDDEGQQRRLEQERLELPRALCHDDRDHHRERQHRQGHAGDVAPHDEGPDRERGKGKIGGRRRVGDDSDDGDHEPEDRDPRTHLVGLRRLRKRPAGHSATVLRRAAPDIP